MLKVAIASEREVVAGHFGHCENFYIFTIENKNITKQALIPNPGHKPGFLPLFLKNLGINVIISGGIGQSAVTLFNEHNIEVIAGAKGSVFEVIDEYIKGKLQYTGSICHKIYDNKNC